MGAQRILITGVGGFVGRHLARHLRARGLEPLGLEREACPPELRALLAAEYVADLGDRDALCAALAAARPAAIVHLAAQSSAARSFEQPIETFQTNVLGTWNLLEAARREAPRARLLIVGTGESYGPQPEGTRVTEQAPFRPVSPYAFSKAVADAGAEACGAAWGLDVVRIRAFSHTGPGQTPRFAVPSFAEQIVAIEAGDREPVLEVGNLDVTRDLLDVRDVVEAYAELLARGRGGSAYNVCRGEGVRLTELVQGLADRARVEVRIEVHPARVRPADVPYLVGDPGAIEREVGWRAKIPLARTLDDLLHEWRLARSPGS